MNILLVAEDAAGIQMLQHLRRTSHRIAGVLASPSQQDRAGASVWSLASKLGYKTWPSKMVKDPDFAAWIVDENIDILLNVHSLFLIHKDVLAAPRLGSYNLHPGPLPRYAGLNSASWAIYKGEVRHGVTLHRMEPGIDTGNIVYQAMVSISAEETGLSLTTKCIDAGIPLVLRLLEVAAQDPPAIPSVVQDNTGREYFGRQVPEDGRLSWDLPARRIVDFIRACDYLPFPSPWGHPRTSLDGRDIGIAKAQLTGIPADEPAGTIGAAVESAVEVACGDDWVLVREVFDGGEYRPAAEVLKTGSRLQAAMEKPAVQVAAPSVASAPQTQPAQVEPAAGHSEYWIKKLTGRLPVLEWPSDHVRPPVSSGARVTHKFPVPDGLRQQATAPDEGDVTAWCTMLATGVAAVLGRYTGQEDILLGGFAGGHLVPLRLDLSGDPSFSELLRRVRETAAAALAQAVPLPLLEADLRPPSDPSRHPFFQIAVALQPSAAANSESAAMLDLCIDVEDGADGGSLAVTYNPRLFEDAAITRFVGHWRNLLEAAAADAALPLSRLRLLTEDERRQIVVEWNATALDYPKATIHALVSAQGRKTPERIAVEMEDRRLSYRELEERSNRLARRLRKMGVGPDVPVGICLERSPEMVVSLLGILKAGGAYVPLDPAFPRQRLQLMLEDAQPVVVITQESLSDIAKSRNQVLVDRDWTSIESEPAEPLAEIAGPRNLAYVLYTSGSTGKPKGVQIEHAAVVNFLISMQREPGLTTADVLLAVTTLSFDIAGLEIYLPLITGARLVLASTETARDGVKLGALLRRSAATVMQATPATWRVLLECGTDLGGLKVLCGGEAMPHELAARLVRGAGSVWNLYGPTETTIWSTLCRLESAEGPVTIGRPIANTQIYILDAHRNPVPVGAIGALYIGGDGLARGYMNRPELTLEKFIPDAFSSQSDARLYNTGDLARYRADGNIDFLGRSDNQVKVRGFRIELGEIEAVMAQHTGVKSAVALVREDTPGDTRLVAYVAAHPGQAPSIEDLRRLLADKLPKYMIPGHIVFMDAFPLTPNGKVDRRAFPLPDTSATALEEEYIAPRNSVEKKLVQIWEDLLGVHPIGVQSSFFDLGGHSLLLVRLLFEIERAFGKSLTVETIFQSETVEQLAVVLGDRDSYETPAVVAIQKSGSRPPFFCLGAGPMFRPMARRFGADQPFLGVRTDPAEWTHLSAPYKFEDIATVFANKIRDYQPEGPYYIGGFCLSGVVAYEVARQFLAEGQEVRRLVLFYSLSPGYFASRSSRAFNLYLQFELAKYHLGRLRSLSGPDFSQYAKDRVQGLIEKLRPQTHQTGPTSEEVMPELEEIGAAAAHNYQPRPSPIPTVLFRPAEDPQGLYWDRQYDWSKYATASLDVHVVPGDHSTMFREPHVEILAEKMKGYLSIDRTSSAG